MPPLRYDEAGSGDTVLLIHAGVADRTMWREVTPPLVEAGYRVIAPDLPGFGEAPVPPGPQLPWEDVLATMQELAVTRAAVVGNSFGAAVALRTAVVAPAAVSALVLVSPPPLALEPSERLSAAWESEEAALAREDIEGAVRAVVDAWLAADAPEELRERVAAMQRRAYQLQLAAGEPEEGPDPVADRPDVLTRLATPTLTMAGEDDMPDFIAGAQEIAARIPGAEYEAIPGVGHLAPLEAPAAFAERLIAFLRRAS